MKKSKDILPYIHFVGLYSCFCPLQKLEVTNDLQLEKKKNGLIET